MCERIKLGRPPIAPVLPVAMIGIGSVPLAAWVRYYISSASRRKGGDAIVFCSARVSCWPTAAQTWLAACPQLAKAAADAD
jgi:hypothetical protein